MERYATHQWRQDSTNLLVISPTGGGKGASALLPGGGKWRFTAELWTWLCRVGAYGQIVEVLGGDVTRSCQRCRRSPSPVVRPLRLDATSDGELGVCLRSSGPGFRGKDKVADFAAVVRSCEFYRVFTEMRLDAWIGGHAAASYPWEVSYGSQCR